MIRIDCSLVVQMPPEAIFPLVSDPVRFPGLFSGITRVEHVSGPERAVGGQYLMLMQVGSIDAGAVFRITEWRAPERIAWVSEQGLSQVGTVTLVPAGGGTRVRIELEYAVPGHRLPAFLVEHLTRHVVERRLHATLLSIRRVAEFDRGMLGAPPAARASG